LSQALSIDAKRGRFNRMRSPPANQTRLMKEKSIDKMMQLASYASAKEVADCDGVDDGEMI